MSPGLGRPPLPPRALAEDKAAMPPRRAKGDAGVVDHELAGDLHLGKGPGALGPAGGQHRSYVAVKPCAQVGDCDIRGPAPRQVS